MRVEVITCDRCDGRVESDLVTLVTIKRGDRVTKRDLCPVCSDRAKDMLVLIGSKTDTKVSPSIEVQLHQIRTLAAKAIEGWNVGDSPDDLVEALRDVATNARR